MTRKILTGVVAVIFILIAGHGWADAPKISNLQFSANPAVIGEEFTISVEFEGHVDCLFIENTWETQKGEIKREVREYTIPSDIKGKQKGVITRQWKIVNASVKAYRIVKICVKDGYGNESNALSGEVKVAMPELKQVPIGQGLVFSVTDIKRGSLDTADYSRCGLLGQGTKWTFKIHRHNTRPVGCKITKEDMDWECPGSPDISGANATDLNWNIRPNQRSSWSSDFFVCENRSCKVKLSYSGKYADGFDIKSVLFIDLK